MKGHISEDALEQYAKLAAEKEGLDFSEGEVYDFTTCVRPDGSTYGSRGKCRKGTEGEGERKEKESKPARKNRDSALNPRQQSAVDAALGRAPGASKVAEGAQREQMRAERVKRLQDMASRGDRKAMAALVKLREQGKIGKEPGFAPGQKAREERKEVANVKAGKSPVADVKPARKPRATAAELKQIQSKLFDVAKEKRAKAREAEKAHKALEKELKNDRKNPENRKRLMETGRAWDQAATAADRAQRSWMKANDKWGKQVNRDNRAKMTPGQLKEQRRIDKIIKERG